MKYHIELFTDAAQMPRWRIVASNGQTIATSGESYVTKSSMLRTVVAFAEATGIPIKGDEE